MNENEGKAVKRVWKYLSRFAVDLFTRLPNFIKQKDNQMLAMRSM